MTRSFAYIGLPSLKLFVGEVVLLLCLVLRPQEILGRWAYFFIGRTPLTIMAVWLSLFLGYGVVQVIHGVLAGYPIIAVLQGLGFNYYPCYLFLGVAAGRYGANFLSRLIRIFAWFNGLYGVAFIVVLNRLLYTLPGTSDVALFSQTNGSAIAILGLLAIEKKPAKVWFLLLINTFVMLGMQIRAEWLGFGIAFLAWVLLARRIGNLMLGASIIGIVLFVLFVTDARIPAPESRGGEISIRGITGRIIAPINYELASELTDIAGNAAATVSWRTDWWKAIWEEVHKNDSSALFGLAYGFPLSGLVPYIEAGSIRTPHNVFFYALGYGGWFGVIVFYGFQLSILAVFLGAGKTRETTFGILVWIFTFVKAHFDNLFETPFGAIPYYLLIGLSVAAILHEVNGARHTGSQPLSTTGR